MLPSYSLPATGYFVRDYDIFYNFIELKCVVRTPFWGTPALTGAPKRGTPPHRFTDALPQNGVPVNNHTPHTLPQNGAIYQYRRHVWVCEMLALPMDITEGDCGASFHRATSRS